MAYIQECIGIAAPYYNLAFVIIVVVLFIKLLSIKNHKLYLKPWKLIFAALCIYIVEEIMTILEGAGLIVIPSVLFPIFEMGMISLFIYALLLQREHLKLNKIPKK